MLVCQSPSLYKLKIEDNKIDSVNKFYCLNQLKLKKINVKGNPFCSEKNSNYKNELFSNIKALESIDNFGKNNENVESTEYVEVEENYDGEEFEEAESGEEKYEENKIEGVEEIEEEENEEGDDEHNFDEDKNKEKTVEELNTKRKRN